MRILTGLSRVILSAVVLSLFSGFGANAADYSFDNPSRGDSLAGSMQELSDQAKGEADVRTPVPVPSTATNNSNELTSFWNHLKDGELDKLCRSAEIRLNHDATIVNVVGIGGGLKRFLRPFPDQRLALIDQIDVKLGASFGTEVLQIPDVAH